MSYFKAEFQLIQRTPLIHFQSGQKGATLRASEVKPKLDRFICTFCKQYSFAIPDEWYINPKEKGEKPALSYKMRIESTGVFEGPKEPHKLYFGNIGSNEHINTVKYAENKLTVITFRKEKIDIKNSKIEAVISGEKTLKTLSEIIIFVLPAFFALNCFGTRSTKGFGSYNVNGFVLNEAYILLFRPVYYTITYSRKISDPNDILNDIWVISNMMKSGFNYSSFRNAPAYYKGRIFRYFSNRNTGSDKAFIKQMVLPGNYEYLDVHQASEERINYENFVFSRAMLGLAQKYEFRRTRNSTRSGIVSISHNKIKRFASPVHYKPNGNVLYIIPMEIPELMYNTAFNLNNTSIHTPTRKQFSLVEFLDWFMGEYNSKTEITGFNDRDISTSMNKNLIMKKVEAKI